MDWGETLSLLSHEATPPAAASLWGGDPDTLMLVSEGVNVVYRFEVRGGRCYLRFTHESLMSERRVASAVDYLHHLFAQGAPVCEPLRSRAGRFVEVIGQGDTEWLATATREAPGDPVGLERTDPAIYEAWGRSLAQMHRAAESYKPSPACWFQHWDDIWGRTRQGLHPADSLAQQEFQQLDRWRQSLPTVLPAFGLTHGDYNPRNVVWDGQQVTTLDFDEPCWGWFEVDIARALLEFIRRPQEQQAQFRVWFLQGYRSCRPFSHRCEARVGGFLRMWALVVYSNQHHFDAGSEPDPFCACIRQRFENPKVWD